VHLVGRQDDECVCKPKESVSAIRFVDSQQHDKSVRQQRRSLASSSSRSSDVGGKSSRWVHVSVGRVSDIAAQGVAWLACHGGSCSVFRIRPDGVYLLVLDKSRLGKCRNSTALH